ncbi:hypothetical protein GQE99_14410 [Maritimibacter sp. DP07]|uniref:Uncharacterized protein n=1 Tax=Maritimibacter harenae TaxID=2606218 RepID=A0A845M4R6_9RHOB|nr:hypothetical protein [Maritimibacter harenae]MZR14212.1 hypothetical protein [Maritimibacter harenae]
MLRYAAVGAAVAILGFSAAVWVLIERNGALRAAQEVSQAALSACTGRVEDILKDKDSDDDIDAISDSDLRDHVRPEWMLPDPAR